MAGRFEIYTDSAGQHRFRLRAGNGEVVLVSEGYKRRINARKGVASVQRNVLRDERFERRTTRSGAPMFNLRASNGQVIGTSEAYASLEAREDGIDAVRRAAPLATVAELP